MNGSGLQGYSTEDGVAMDSDQHGRDGSDNGWWLCKSIHVLTALAHQRTPVQLLLFVCQNELNAPVALGRERSDTGHPEQWTVEKALSSFQQASSSIDFGMIERTKGFYLNFVQNIMENSVNRTRNGAHHAMIHTRSDVDVTQ
uniref:Uncharacterized protein n=1 Tax=Oryza sativa subsp. japonica TaxID=39947 RepID=Q652M0_ORYSJ|nr:hypothetical protein [Oryza sativa Japonica Group]